MSKAEALLFLSTYVDQIKNTWDLSPEGRYLHRKFKEAIEAIEKEDDNTAGNYCPHCGSKNAFSNGPIDQVYGGDKEIVAYMYCDDCKKDFGATYKIHSVEKS
jgi:hypothetical protein